MDTPVVKRLGAFEFFWLTGVKFSPIIQTMAPPKYFNSQCPGFSLVELLVVIVVLGILAALLSGGLVRSRDSARATKSMNNVRSITLAYIAYAAEHGHYPATGNYSGGGWGPKWTDLLVQGDFIDFPDKDLYLTNSHRYFLRYLRPNSPQAGPFWCPAEKSHHGIADYGPSDNVVPHSRAVLPLPRILKPSTTILISESRSFQDGKFRGSWWLKSEQWLRRAPDPPSGGSPVPARHNGYFHVGFCDGHVEKISEERAYEERATLFTGPHDRTNPDYFP